MSLTCEQAWFTSCNTGIFKGRMLYWYSTPCFLQFGLFANKNQPLTICTLLNLSVYVHTQAHLACSDVRKQNRMTADRESRIEVFNRENNLSGTSDISSFNIQNFIGQIQMNSKDTVSIQELNSLIIEYLTFSKTHTHASAHTHTNTHAKFILIWFL